MAIYRFRISFEDYDDIIREIDIKSSQTFEDLHRAIHKTTGYDPEHSSSFYISNDHWIRGEEIAFLPTQRKTDQGVKLMSAAKLSQFIDDPHQKFYYTYNFERPYDFHVELIKISLEADPAIAYPTCVKTVGEAPKVLDKSKLQAIASTAEDPDILDMDLDEDHEEDADEFDHVRIDTAQELGEDVQEEGEAESEEEDEFMDEFSDNENMDEDNGYSKDDY